MGLRTVPSWITDYYAALILWNVERNDEALNLLKKWEDEPDFSPFYFSRAYLQGILSDGALEDMERALEIDPGQWRIYQGTGKYAHQTGGIFIRPGPGENRS